MIGRTLNFSHLLIISSLFLNIFLALVTNVATLPSDSDIAVFRTVLGLEKPEMPMSYEQELKLIKHLQELVLKKAPGNYPIPEYQDREPKSLFQAQSGLCFDRSRTFDKLFHWFGFETRHVYILYSEHPVTGDKCKRLGNTP